MYYASVCEAEHYTCWIKTGEFSINKLLTTEPNREVRQWWKATEKGIAIAHADVGSSGQWSRNVPTQDVTTPIVTKGSH